VVENSLKAISGDFKISGASGEVNELGWPLR
jgi:hypothetical protein